MKHNVITNTGVYDVPDVLVTYNPVPAVYIEVGQSYFWFDADGTFLGVECDEMNIFEKPTR